MRRVPDPANRRVIRIELTDTGRSTLRALRSARRAAAEEILAPLTADQREVLGDLLSTLVDDPCRPHRRRRTDRTDRIELTRSQPEECRMPLLEPNPEPCAPPPPAAPRTTGSPATWHRAPPSRCAAT